MPGLLSTVFADDQGGDAETTAASQSSDVAADQGLDLSPEVGIGMEMGGSYQTLDGSTTTWSQDVNVHVALDVDATLGAAGSLGSSETDAG